ncbi:MAG TPA: hypothetical protein VFD70_13270 [Anaerolineae bacterium]|nr:hypothetical protein [Anaerolineae bacterium]
MDTPNTPSEKTPSQLSEEHPHGGIEITGGEVHADHDIVAGDVNIAGDSITGQNVTVQRGYSAGEVQRLVIIVGGLVFLTAACFFIFGALSAAAVVGVINRPLVGGSSPQKAAEMQAKIDNITSMPPGSSFQQVFTEDEVSSYFRFILAPRLGVTDGKARFMDEPGQIALGGNLTSAGNLPFLAQVELTTDPVPVHLEAVWVKVLPTPEGSAFGWVVVTPLAQRFEEQINSFLLGKVQFNRIVQVGGGKELDAAGRNRVFVWGMVR